MTNRLELQEVLLPEEYQQIDLFCLSNSGIDSLPKIASFLKTNFSLELALDSDIVDSFASDSSNLPGKAHAVCRPTTERECAIISRVSFQAGIPLTVSAGRTNLTGSATPEGGIVLSIGKLASPAVVVDKKTKTVRAPVGMILEDLRNMVLEQSEQQLIFPVDPTSRAEAAIGGAIACNASGFTPGTIGSMRDWVAELDFIFPNGLKLSAKRGKYYSQEGEFILLTQGKEIRFPVPTHPRPAIKNASGPYSSEDGVLDFVDLVVGSEGIFGLVTAVTLKLQEKASSYLDLLFSLPGEKEAIKLLHYLNRKVSQGLSSFSALEYFGANCRRYMNHEDWIFKDKHQVAIYIQRPLYQVSLEEAAEEWLQLLIEADCAIDEEGIRLIENERDRKIFMEARHSLPANALELVQRYGTYTIMTDTVVELENFENFLNKTHHLIRDAGIDYLAFGHFGDCHLHFTLLPTKEQLGEATEIYNRIVEISAALGGIYSGEHGTGKRKRGDFLKCYGKQALENLYCCKAAIDPSFLVNRGNVIPYYGELKERKESIRAKQII